MTRTNNVRKAFTFVLIAAAMILEACGGMKQVINSIGNGGQTVRRAIAGSHSGSVAIPAAVNNSHPIAAAAMLFQAATPAPSQLQQLYDAQCDFSANPGFLASVPDGAFVPLGLFGVPQSVACSTFTTPARAGIGKRTAKDGTLQGLVAEITTTTGQSIECTDLTTQVALLDGTRLQVAVVPAGGNLTIAVLVTGIDGAVTPQPFTCPVTVAPTAVQSIEVNLSKI